MCGLRQIGHREPSLLLAVSGSADVDRPLLCYKLGGSLWLSGQLKNRGLLTLTKERQQQDLAVGKFERIVMGHCLFFVDLPKDRCSVVEHFFRQPNGPIGVDAISPAKDSSVPGRTQTATPASSDAANPRVPAPKFFERALEQWFNPQRTATE